MTIKRLHAGPRMSQAVVHGSTVYLAGQVADQARGKSVAEQTKEILATIERSYHLAPLSTRDSAVNPLYTGIKLGLDG